MTETRLAPLHRYTEVEGLGDPGRFGFAWAVRGGDLLYISGLLGIDEGFRPVSDVFEEQAEAVFDHLRNVLAAAGLGPESLVSMTIFLTDMAHSAALFPIREAKLGSIQSSSAVVGVAELVLPELKVELQGVALAVPHTGSGS